MSCASIQQTISVPPEIKAYCSRISGEEQNRGFMRTCIEQERTAQQRLVEMTIPSHVTTYCKKLSYSTGGSYQVMLACVEKELSEL